MSFKVVKSKKEGDCQSFEISSGLRLFGVWFRPEREPVVQRIIVPLDESLTNRYLNVKEGSTRLAILKAVENFKDGDQQT